MSMSVDHEIGDGFRRLEDIQIESIQPNPRNPRLIFPEDELDRLAASIAQEGILVPIVVFENEDATFTLIDGERRYKCARRLGFEQVPALVANQKDEAANLVSMFNIHYMREPWRDIPTARALETLSTATKEQTGTDPKDSSLAEQTGLSVERVKRLRFAIQLPAEYQEYIDDGTIPLNWFWELDRNVVQPLAKKRQQIFAEFGADGILGAFVKKRLAGVITDTVSLRDVRPIINFAERDAQESGSIESILDDTIRRLITDVELTISTAYEDTVQIMVETNKLLRSTENMIKGFSRLLARTRNETERATVLDIAISLRTELARLIEENRS